MQELKPPKTIFTFKNTVKLVKNRIQSVKQTHRLVKSLSIPFLRSSAVQFLYSLKEKESRLYPYQTYLSKTMKRQSNRNSLKNSREEAFNQLSSRSDLRTNNENITDSSYYKRKKKETKLEKKAKTFYSLISRLYNSKTTKNKQELMNILKKNQLNTEEKEIKNKLMGAKLLFRCLKRRLIFNKLTFISSCDTLNSYDQSG